MIRQPLPNPQQIRDYLEAHGWRESHEIPPVGTMYQAAILSDDGEPLTVFVPAHAEFDDYPIRVPEIVHSLTVLERRSKEAVWADLLAEPSAATPPSARTAEAVPESPTQPLV